MGLFAGQLGRESRANETAFARVRGVATANGRGSGRPEMFTLFTVNRPLSSLGSVGKLKRSVVFGSYEHFLCLDAFSPVRGVATR